MPASAATTSCCSDIREMNDAKVNSILSYLDTVTVGDSFSRGSIGFGRHSLTAEAMHQLERVGSSHSSSACGPLGICTDRVLNSENIRPQQECSGGKVPASKASVASNVSFTPSAMMGLHTGADGAQVYSGIKKRIEELKSTVADLTRERDELAAKWSGAKEGERARIERVQKIATEEIEEIQKEHKRQYTSQTSMVSKLLAEKERLVATVEELRSTLKDMAERKERETRKLEDAHVTALNDMKGKWLVQEKQKREQWMLKEAKRIKEATLKAMEPDIALLMNRHKAEKARMKEEFDNEIKRREEQLEAKEATIQSVKERNAAGVEESIQRERDTFRKRILEQEARFDSMLDEQRRQFADKKSALEAFHADQRAAQQQTVKELEREIFALKASGAEESGRFLAEVSKEVERQVEQREAHFKNRERMREEQAEALKAKLVDECDAQLKREREELRIVMRKERDEAVSKVIAQLEAEHVAQLTAERENDKLTKEKYARQDRDFERLQREHQLTLQQLTSISQQFDEQNRVVQRLQQEIKELRERESSVQGAAERAFEGRLQALDTMWQQKLHRFETSHVDDVLRLNSDAEMSKKAANEKIGELESELRNTEQRYNLELSNINDRVVGAMAKKDSQVHMLQEQLRLAQQLLNERDAELERHRSLLA